MVVTVPHEMLSKTYQTISELFPATYAANGYYTITNNEIIFLSKLTPPNIIV